MELNTLSIESASLEDQYILTEVGERRVAFPAASVAGILLVERSRVLALPFYQDVVLGIVHHQGQLVPLVALQQLLSEHRSSLREVFNAIQLSEQSDAPGLGLIVDRLLGNCTAEALANNTAIEPFCPDQFESSLWQPQRWMSLSA